MVAVCGVSELLKQLDIAVGQRTKQTVISPHGCSLGHDQLTSKFFLGFLWVFLVFFWVLGVLGVWGVLGGLKIFSHSNNK